jgi:putative DNA primase/helicase
VDAFSELAPLARKLGLRRSGAGFRGPCPVHGGTKSPFALRSGVGGKLLVHCHAGCDPADILGALRRKQILPQEIAARPRAKTPEPPRDRSPRDWSSGAQMLWDRGTPIAGTAVERYLAARGCAVPETEALRFLEPGAFGPLACMMALVCDVVTARPITLHFTRLNADGTAKADVERPKLLLSGHRKSGGCIRLTPDDEVTLGLGIAEGIETTLAVMQFGWAPVWATVDAGNMKSFPVLPGIEALTLFADHDPAGLDAARSCARRWHDAGREVVIATPTAEGFDFADLNKELME